MIPKRIKQTINNSSYKKYNELLEKGSGQLLNDVVVFDMRFLIPDRRLVQIFSQFTEAGYYCVFYCPNYFFWLKAAFLKKWSYSYYLFINGIVNKMPSKYILVTSSKGAYTNCCCEFCFIVDDEIMDDLEKYRDKDFFYPILFHPTKMNINYEKMCLGINNEKRIGILFIGNNGEEYNKYKATVHNKYNTYTRRETLDYLRESCSFVYTPNSYKELMEAVEAGKTRKQIVIIDKFRIEDDNYIKILGLSSFFLYTSGVIIPFCHNHIESVACGCIPIVQFNNYYPGLINCENAYTYENLEELRDICINICNNDPCNNELYKEMGRKARSWYINYWSYDSFIYKFKQVKNHDIKTAKYYIFKELSPKLERIEKYTSFRF